MDLWVNLSSNATNRNQILWLHTAHTNNYNIQYVTNNYGFWEGRLFFCVYFYIV